MRSLRPSTLELYQAASFLAEKLPTRVTHGAVSLGGQIGANLAGDRRLILERNLERAGLAMSREAQRRAAVGRALASYGRYYVDSFRLPSLSPTEVDAGFRYVGFEHIQKAVDEDDTSPLLVLPHLGGWEWAGFWLATQHQLPVTVVVETIEPPELFDWFMEYRESIGYRVIPADGQAGPEVVRSLNENRVTCLMADRVVGDVSAVAVEFFGEKTLLPAGPATLALRTGASLIPTAVYFEDDFHFAHAMAPVPAEREGKFRHDVQRVTQLMANDLEALIRAAPEQWHLLQPNWPSDFRALGRPLPERYAEL